MLREKTEDHADEIHRVFDHELATISDVAAKTIGEAGTACVDVEEIGETGEGALVRVGRIVADAWTIEGEGTGTVGHEAGRCRRARTAIEKNEQRFDGAIARLRRLERVKNPTRRRERCFLRRYV